MTEIQKRLRAARAYAGLTLDELAERIGMGRQTVVRMERNERPARTMELREIAHACGLPYEFFSADFELLKAIVEAWPDDDLLDRLGAKEIPPEALVTMAFEALDETVDRQRREDGSLATGSVLIPNATTEQQREINRVFRNVIAMEIDEVRERFEERIAELEARLVRLQQRDREQAREDLERELEAVAQRLELPRGSTEQAKSDRPRRGHGA